MLWPSQDADIESECDEAEATEKDKLINKMDDKGMYWCSHPQPQHANPILGLPGEKERKTRL
jgi:hypothetical protein